MHRDGAGSTYYFLFHENNCPLVFEVYVVGGACYLLSVNKGIAYTVNTIAYMSLSA